MCLQLPALMFVVMVAVMVVVMAAVDACYNESGIAFAFLGQYCCQLCLFFFLRGGDGMLVFFYFSSFFFSFAFGFCERVDSVRWWG
jgi:hypothetical protein